MVFGKALRILGQAELFEPIRNLLHGGPPDLTLSVLDRENRKSTTRRNILQRPHKGHMSVEGQTLEVEPADVHFRFTLQSRHPAGGLRCPFSANSRHGPLRMSLQRAEAARRRLLNSTLMIVDQATNGGLHFRARRFQQFVLSYWLRGRT